jgi:mono/diheme cytochrome c family protein
MTTRIFLGTLLFLLIFVVVGYALLNEGLLDVQAQDSSGRMQVFKASQDARGLEAGAAIFEQYCSTCHGDRGEGIAGRGPQLNPYLFTTRFPELQAANYPNTLKNFVKLTVAAGRPVYSTYWSDKGEVYSQNMPTWSAQVGGPLRDDQVENVTLYIMSWQAAAGEAQAVAIEAIASDLTKELPAGDTERGRKLFTKELLLESGRPAPCSACHSLQPGQDVVGPSLAGIGTRAASTVSGQDAATYIRHSIQAPGEYLVPGDKYQSNGQSLMPANLGNDMTAQDLADMIAYLLTLK